MKRFSGLVLLLVVLGFLSHTEAALIDRGGGLIYDTALNVTWLQDANYAKTSSYGDGSGRMTWDQAMTWSANLQYYDSVRNVAWTDWRLPKILPINGHFFDTNWSYNGATDVGYNISAIGSAYPLSTNNELAFMYYNNLSGIGQTSVDGGRPTNYGLNGNCGLFLNLQTIGTPYFSGSEFVAGPDSGTFAFSFNEGYQSSQSIKRNEAHAWAVRDGDVAPVPLPSAIWLFGSGLAGIMGYIKLKGNRRA